MLVPLKALPFRMVIPARVTTPASTSNTRKLGVLGALLRITVSFSGPGPDTVRLWSMTSVLDSMMVAGSFRAKLMWSPGAELAMAWRREPGPLSFTLVTVRTVGRPLGVASRLAESAAASFEGGGTRGVINPAKAGTAPRQSATAVEHRTNEASFFIELVVYWLDSLELMIRCRANLRSEKS